MALPIALGILAVMSISTVTVVEFSSANARSSSRSGGDKVAQALGEAGINNAMAVLMRPGTNALNRYAFCPDSDVAPTLPCWNTSTYEGGSVNWTGTLFVTSQTAYWLLEGIGRVRNPTGGSRLITRRLTARAPVYPASSQPLNSPAWNYIYSRDPGPGVPFASCEMTLANSVAVNSPLYVNGNLCMQNTATIIGGGLFVRGSLQMFQNANRVGSSTAPIADAHIAKGCKYVNQAGRDPCVYGAPSAGDNVFANILDTNAGNVEPPTVLWNEWYLNASPGPYYPCLAPGQGDFSNPTWVFDNPVAAGSASNATKLTFRNNNAGLINLTPGTSYTCKTFAGELTWNASTRTFTVRGTMYIDGSAKIDNGALNRYTGQGVIYMSGTLLIKNSKLCGAVTADGTNCTTSGWNPNEHLITFVANGRGATGSPDNQVSAANGVEVVSSHVQGAIYATHVIDVKTTSLVDGPLDGSTVILGQTSNSAFPPFTIVPSGMPGNEAVYAVTGNPEMFSG